jgi:general secretion pathway protein G
LADIGFGGQLDPWGNAYQYLNFADIMGLADVRKDRNLVPINTDFDLYSEGPDGDSLPPLTAPPSRDDIVRANDGRFVGKGEDY